VRSLTLSSPSRPLLASSSLPSFTDALAALVWLFGADRLRLLSPSLLLQLGASAELAAAAGEAEAAAAAAAAAGPAAAASPAAIAAWERALALCGLERPPPLTPAHWRKAQAARPPPAPLQQPLAPPPPSDAAAAADADEETQSDDGSSINCGRDDEDWQELAADGVPAWLDVLAPAGWSAPAVAEALGRYGIAVLSCALAPELRANDGAEPSGCEYRAKAEGGAAVRRLLAATYRADYGSVSQEHERRLMRGEGDWRSLRAYAGPLPPPPPPPGPEPAATAPAAPATAPPAPTLVPGGPATAISATTAAAAAHPPPTAPLFHYKVRAPPAWRASRVEQIVASDGFDVVSCTPVLEPHSGTFHAGRFLLVTRGPVAGGPYTTRDARTLREGLRCGRHDGFTLTPVKQAKLAGKSFSATVRADPAAEAAAASAAAAGAVRRCRRTDAERRRQQR